MIADPNPMPRMEIIAMPNLATKRKALAAALAGIVQILSTITLPDQWKPYATLLIAVAGVLGVHQASNDDVPADERGASDVVLVLLGAFVAIVLLYIFGYLHTR